MLLNGNWTVTGTDQHGNPLSLCATVPGCVHTDLINGGLIKDIFYRDNAAATQWIEQCDFTYTTEFSVEKEERDSYIRFEGLDTYCDVLLNGEKIGSADDMFIPYEFPVDGILHAGKNTLEVRFYSPVRAVENEPKRKGCFTTERLYTRRIQCTYGWDWVDRFVTMGIYRDVKLICKKRNEIKSHYIYTKNINPLSAQVELSVEIDRFVDSGDYLTVEVLAPNGESVYSRKRTIISDTVKQCIDIPSPQLWYPNGYGEQPLYTLRLTTTHGVDESRFGIREIAIVQLTDKEESDYRQKAKKLQKNVHLLSKDKNEQSSSFIVLVNGVKIMCKGANWVPCEPFPSAETPQKINRLLELGVISGLNMLRVWGGGLFECDAFYDECDRLGILVLQDFLMACGHYPEEREDFVAALKKETEAAAYRLRNHTCLAWWHGDNENAVWGNENITDYPGYISATYGMKPILERLDPQRVFLPSSPYGGTPFASAVCGTTHNSEFMGDFFTYAYSHELESHTEFLNRYLARFCSEQPTMGMPFVSSLKKFLTDEDIFGDDLSMLEYHTKNNPDFGAITLYNYCNRLAERIFGDYKNGKDRLYKLQMLQCEWVRISLELFRRNKWFSSGILYWMFNDCWPAANGWSLVDYYACPKPAYYMFKRCAKPIIASIERGDNDFKVYISNDSLESAEGKGKLYLYDYINDVEIISNEFDFSSRSNESGVVLSVPANKLEEKMTSTTILLCDIQTSEGTDRAFYLPLCYHNQVWSESGVRVISETDGEITVTCDGFTPFVMLDTPYLLEENCFTLKAGEEKTIKIIKPL